MHAWKGGNRAQSLALANIECLRTDYEFETQRNTWKELFCTHQAASLGLCKAFSSCGPWMETEGTLGNPTP